MLSRLGILFLAGLLVVACSDDDAAGNQNDGGSSNQSDASIDGSTHNNNTSTDDGGTPPDEVVAFPGAQGFGARATGGRGGAVVKVTNLDESGTGSLNWAVSQAGPRIVVFEVSGVIPGDVTIPHGDITIAGQTAPCAGITLNGTLYTPYGDDTSNIIIRHLRVSPPDPTGSCSQHDAIQMSTANTLILDHVDASHGGDENVDFWGGAHDITVQWSSIVYPIAGGPCDHPKGILNHRACIDGGSCSASDPLGGRISVHHNLFAHCRNRTPALSTGPADVINNVVYNGREGFVHHNIVGAHSTDPAAVGDFNIIGNSYIDGPSASLAPLWMDPENASGPIPTRYFVSDNWVEDSAFNGRFDNPFTTAGFESEYGFYCCGVEASQFDTTQAFDYSGDAAYVPVTVHARDTGYTEVLAKAGAWPRDIITRTAAQDVTTRTGAQTNYIPVDFLDGLSPCAPPVDTDGDGMPDAWESANGLDSGIDDHNRSMPSGYTAIEEYINELADSLVGG